MKSIIIFLTTLILVLLKTATPFPTETTTVPYDSCYSCRDAPVQFTDVWAGQCVPSSEETVNCRCNCLSIFCRAGEIIDTTTCRREGSISDCRCIPIEEITTETVTLRRNNERFLH